MSVTLRLRYPNNPQPQHYPLAAEYTLDEVQELINQAEQAGADVTLLAADGSYVEFDPANFREPPAVITVVLSNVDQYGRLH